MTIWKDRSAKAGQTEEAGPHRLPDGPELAGQHESRDHHRRRPHRRLLAGKAGLPTVKLDPLKLDIDFVHRTVSRPFAARYLMIPLDQSGRKIFMAVADPFDTEGMDVLARPRAGP